MILVSADEGSKKIQSFEKKNALFNYYTFDNDFMFYNGHSAIGINGTRISNSLFKESGYIVVVCTEDSFLEVRMDSLEELNATYIDSAYELLNANFLLNTSDSNPKRISVFFVEDLREVVMSKIYIPIRREYEGEFNYYAIFPIHQKEMLNSRIVDIGSFNLTNIS